MHEETPQSVFRTWADPQSEFLGLEPSQFLEMLGGPAHIHLRGLTAGKCRVVVTLLHGNEPSGVRAVLAILQQHVVPIVDVHVFIVNVEAALAPPLFSHRSLPGRRDLNRCFKPPFSDDDGVVAKILLEQLVALEPESIIDVHNTSGAGASFAVVTHFDHRHDALAALFTSTMIVTDLRLGSLMEAGGCVCPTITIESGGAMSAEAFATAYAGLSAYIRSDNIFTREAAPNLSIYRHPLRLELRDKESAALAIGDRPVAKSGVTLVPHLEMFNLRIVTAADVIGFLDDDLARLLTAKSGDGVEEVGNYFRVDDGRLQATRALKIFMAAGNLGIARSDCLFYFVPVGAN